MVTAGKQGSWHCGTCGRSPGHQVQDQTNSTWHLLKHGCPDFSLTASIISKTTNCMSTSCGQRGRPHRLLWATLTNNPVSVLELGVPALQGISACQRKEKRRGLNHHTPGGVKCFLLLVNKRNHNYHCVQLGLSCPEEVLSLPWKANLCPDLGLLT